MHAASYKKLVRQTHNDIWQRFCTFVWWTLVAQDVIKKVNIRRAQIERDPDIIGHFKQYDELYKTLKVVDKSLATFKAMEDELMELATSFSKAIAGAKNVKEYHIDYKTMMAQAEQVVGERF